MLIIKDLPPFIFMGGQEWNVKQVSPEQAEELVGGVDCKEPPTFRPVPMEDICRSAQKEGALIMLGNPGNAHYLLVTLKDKKPDLNGYKSICPKCELKKIELVVGTDLMAN